MLSRVTAKYWYSFEGTGQSENAVVDWAGKQPSGAGITQYVTAQIQAIEQSGQTRVQVTGFTENAGSIGPGEYAQAQLRIHKNDWSNYTQSNDYSFGAHNSFADWSRVTLYFDGVKVWGYEPGEVGAASVPKYHPLIKEEAFGSASAFVYPNPCGEKAVIRFAAEEGDEINIYISDIQNRPVRAIKAVNSRKGINYIVWDLKNSLGTDVGNGIYLMRATDGSSTVIKKIAVIRQEGTR